MINQRVSESEKESKNGIKCKAYFDNRPETYRKSTNLKKINYDLAVHCYLTNHVKTYV